jgi:hypothetical protein
MRRRLSAGCTARSDILKINQPIYLMHNQRFASIADCSYLERAAHNLNLVVLSNGQRTNLQHHTPYTSIHKRF